MSLRDGYFVNGDTAKALEARPPEALAQRPLLNVLDPIPTKSNDGRDILNRRAAQQREDVFSQALRVALAGAGKADFHLADEAAIRTSDTRHGPSNNHFFVADGRRLKVPRAASTPNDIRAVAHRTAGPFF